MVSEVTNATWRKVRPGEIGRGEAGTLAAARYRFTGMPMKCWGRMQHGSPSPLIDRSTIVLALAYRIGGQVVTADARLANALAATEHGRSWGCWAVLCRSDMSDSIGALSISHLERGCPMPSTVFELPVFSSCRPSVVYHRRPISTG